MNCLAVVARAVAGLSLLSVASAQQIAWARVAPPGAGSTFTPAHSYQFSTSGQSITVDPVAGADHVVRVHIPGMPGSGGVVHASAYGGNHVAVVHSWTTSLAGTVSARIETYDATGAPAERAKFTVFFRRGGGAHLRQAYVLADQPTTASYSPSADHAWNGSRGTPNIVRLGTGTYRVELPGLAPTSAVDPIGVAQACAYGSVPTRVKIDSVLTAATDIHVTVLCENVSGAPVDGGFVLSFHREPAPFDPSIGSGAYSWAGGSSSYYGLSFFASDDDGLVGPRHSQTCEHFGLGRYRVRIPSMKPSLSASAQVTGVWSGHASLERWYGDGRGGTYVEVRTFRASGEPRDGQFYLQYMSDAPAETLESAWALVEPAGQGAQFQPRVAHPSGPTSSPYSQGGRFTVRARTPHGFEVALPGRRMHFPHVCAYGNNHYPIIAAHTVGDTTTTTLVDVFDAGGSAVDGQPFLLHLRNRGRPTDRAAHVIVDAQARVGDHWNGGRAAPTVSRTTTGQYAVTLPGLSNTGGKLGHVQVSAMGSGPARATVASWVHRTSDVLVTVHCHDHAGTPTDFGFVLSYHEIATPVEPWEGQGAHVWAGSPTASSYAPSPSYFDSNGTHSTSDPPSIRRLGTGLYRVRFPDVAIDWDGGVAVVTAYGSGARRASVDWWGAHSDGSTLVDVRTYDRFGFGADSAFNLLLLSHHPVLATAFADNGAGAACNGAALFAATRPVLGHDWDLVLHEPPGSVFGFVQLGLSNPALPVGPLAPGCTLFTDGIVSRVFELPAPAPAFTLAVPSNPVFVGVEIFAQGGAFVPDINPYWLAASGSVIGRIGHL